ncbi:MAG: hypothetical protein R3323_09925 [Wenzhouxiangellaceae bacterium]|nr:hypothetical protein [Wenzhouxiangellaceae bacterium]
MRRLSSLVLFLLAAPVLASPFNNRTNPDVMFPPGCLVGPVTDDAPPFGNPDQILVDTSIDAPIRVGDDYLRTAMDVTIWRYGCPDGINSVVMIRLWPNTSAAALPRIPELRVFLNPGADEEQYSGRLVTRPEATDMSVSGTVLAEATTFMLAVEPDSALASGPFTVADYNGPIDVELTWDGFDSAGQFDDDFRFGVPFFVDSIDAPQNDQPVFHGRYSGQWVLSGKPGQGLLTQVGELPNGDRFIFVIMFTYDGNGQPVWVTGNTVGAADLPGAITIEVQTVTGGDFFTNPPGSYDQNDIERAPIGTMTLTPIDCNTMDVQFDFTTGGFGTGTLSFDRLIDLAGYVCNPPSLRPL